MRASLFANTIVRSTLILLAFLLPFFVIPAAWVSVPQSKLLLVAVLLTVVLVGFLFARMASGSVLVPRHSIFFAAALLPLCYLFSALLSGASIDSYVSGFGDQETVATMTILFGTLALASIAFAGRSSKAVLPLFALLGGGSVVMLFQIARLVFPSVLSLGGAMAGNASSVVGSWHDLGILSGLLVFLAIALAQSAEVSNRVRLYLAALGVAAFLLLTVVSFADVWYALSALLVIAAIREWYVAQKAGVDAAKRILLSLSIGIFALLAGYGNTFLFAHMPSAWQINAVEVRPSWQVTLSMGERVFSGSQALFGSGPDTFADQWAKWKPLSVNSTNFWSTNFNTGVGLIPTAFVTAGSFGAFAWLALLLALLYRAFLFVRQEHSERHALYAALFGGSLYLLWFHIVYAPSLALSITLFLLLGLMVALDTNEHKRTLLVRTGSRSAGAMLGAGILVIFIVVSVSACVQSARAAVSDLFVAKAGVDYAQGMGVPDTLALIQTALRVYPSNTVAHRAAVEMGLLQLRGLLQTGSSASSTELQAALKETIDQGLAAVAIDSGDYQNWLELAGLYQQLANAGISGAYENALDTYKRAALVNPTSPIPLLNAGEVTLTMGNASSALPYFDAALALKPDLASAYYLRSKAEAALGAYIGAIQDAEQAVVLAKQDPQGWYNLGVILYASGDYPDAGTALSQAISLQNAYANAYFMLSLALEKQGARDKAVQAMQKVIALDPSNATAQQALTSLLSATSTPTSTPAKKP